MKAISMWQPWASAVMLGSKVIETRSWLTHYRGPLVIHASKHTLAQYEAIAYESNWSWCGALAGLGHFMGGKDSGQLLARLPFGKLIGVVDLVDCRPTETFTVAELDMPRHCTLSESTLYDWTERMLGNFAPGRYGWVLANPRPFAQPIAWRGSQGFFTVLDSVIETAK